MKKGQSEMVGLAIIVVLLIISLLLYISFKINSQKESETVRSSVRANNVLNAVLLVNIDNKQMKDLLKECQNQGNCTDVGTELEGIFNVTLLERQRYRFVAYKDNNEIFFLGEECSDFVNANPARFPDGYRYEFKLCYS